jgi:hypothetical protein
MAQTINIAFPFKETQFGGIFLGTTTSESALQSDLIYLLTSRRNSRVMNSQLYSPVFDYIFEQSDSIMQTNLTNDIKDKVKQFIPQIKINNITYSTNPITPNLMTMLISYSITSLFNVNQTLELNIPITQ